MKKTIEEKRTDFVKSALNKQFEIAGYDKKYEDCLLMDDWFIVFSITVEQEEEFKKWFLKQYKKIFKIDGIKVYDWFHLMYGLRIAEPKK